MLQGDVDKWNIRRELGDDDFEDVFCLNFVVSEDCFGEARESPLKKDGERIPVTKENRKEYVNLYCGKTVGSSVKIFRRILPSHSFQITL